MKSSLQLILKDISDRYIRENFQRLQKHLDAQLFGGEDFKFFEIDIKTASVNLPIPHGLSFVPRDIILLATQGDYNVYFRYDKFDSKNIYVTAAGPVAIRFIAGVFDNGIVTPLKTSHTFVAPT